MNQPAERNRFSFGFCFFIVVAGIALDQAVKLTVADPFRNYNFAFSFPVPQSVMYAIYMSVLLTVISYLTRRFAQLNSLQRVAWSLIMAGALSNIGERVALGFVRDFIPLFGGILNVADLLIMAGVAILLHKEIFRNHQVK